MELTFYLLLHALHAGEKAFQTGWFVESLATQILVIFVIRTRLNPLKSRPHPVLAWTSIGIVCVACALPYLVIGEYFGLVALPSRYYGMLAALVAIYLAIAQVAKSMFYGAYDAGARPFPAGTDSCEKNDSDSR